MEPTYVSDIMCSPHSLGALPLVWEPFFTRGSLTTGKHYGIT
jgi:hypothetical protein